MQNLSMIKNKNPNNKVKYINHLEIVILTHKIQNNLKIELKLNLELLNIIILLKNNFNITF